MTNPTLPLFYKSPRPLVAARDATPSEHPDTATLRGIRERAKDEEALAQAALRGANAQFAVEGNDTIAWDDANQDGLRSEARAMRAHLLTRR